MRRTCEGKADPFARKLQGTHVVGKQREAALRPSLELSYVERRAKRRYCCTGGSLELNGLQNTLQHAFMRSSLIEGVDLGCQLCSRHIDIRSYRASGGPRLKYACTSIICAARFVSGDENKRNQMDRPLQKKASWNQPSLSSDMIECVYVWIRQCTFMRTVRA